MVDELAVTRPSLRGADIFTPAKLQAFIAVVEGGTFSAAARRLHISQPALSQTIAALERQLGTQLLIRSNSGVQPTAAGRTLLIEGRAILARHDQLWWALTVAATESRTMRIGIPAELDSGLLRAVARFAEEHPNTRVIPRHLPMMAQLTGLRHGELDLCFTREHPGSDFDTMLVAQTPLGVLLSGELASRLGTSAGLGIETLSGLDWIGCSRSSSPKWYDELAATLTSHGVYITHREGDDALSLPSVIFTELGGGRAFALGSQDWDPVPDTIVWRPLIGNPIVRRTWAVSPAPRRHRDIAHLIANFKSTNARTFEV